MECIKILRQACHAVAVGGGNFPCFWLCISLLSQTVFPVICCGRTAKKYLQNRLRRSMRCDFPCGKSRFPCIFPCFLPLRPGSPQTASSASQSLVQPGDIGNVSYLRHG